ncbi:hypothetical protein [Streptomyces akebiae]|nr:hypothetical protein [Streptomyces akebiae]
MTWRTGPAKEAVTRGGDAGRPGTPRGVPGLAYGFTDVVRQWEWP